MSDSSSVDRWHPSNVEWPNEKAPPGPVRTSVNWLLGEDKPGRGALSIGGIQVIPADAYEALYAVRGRVLAAVEKRVEGLRLVPPNVGYGDGWQDYNSAIDDALNAIKSSSSSSTEEREV